jgi:hypothetical protein
MRELTLEELELVAGGTDTGDIVVTGDGGGDGGGDWGGDWGDWGDFGDGGGGGGDGGGGDSPAPADPEEIIVTAPGRPPPVRLTTGGRTCSRTGAM